MTRSLPYPFSRSSAERRIAAVLLLLAALWIAPSAARCQAVNILYLNSYHYGYKWSDEIYQGFVDSLQPKNAEIALHVEYLDTKRYPGEERYPLLADIIAEKYRDIPIDLVVSADDASFLLLQRHHAALFPEVPVFFCGTNYLNPDVLGTLPRFHGVNERAEIGETFRIILELLPDTRQVYIINDRTITGRKVHDQIAETIKVYGNRLEFTFWEDVSMPELIARVNDIGENSVIFYTFFLQDITGQTFEYNHAISLVHRQSPVPIFGAWDFNLGLGLTGGMLTSGYQQGKAVAGLVNDWLGGASLAEIPRLTSSPNRFMFDHAQLVRFSLPRAKLPPETIIINQPTGFIQKHRKVLITSGFFILMLLAVIGSLTINIHRRKQVEKELRQSEENFRSIFDNANDGLYQLDPNGRFIRVNPAFARMLKFAGPQEVIDYFSDIDNQLYASPTEGLRHPKRYRDSGWSRGEHTLRCRDGALIDVIETTHAVHDEAGRLLYFEGSVTDITEYKKTRELMAQTEKIVSLGGVSAGIAHEIRSPLSSIIQGVQLVKNRLLDITPANLQAADQCGCPLDRIRQYAQNRDIATLLTDIRESGRRAGVIIEDMLSFSRKTIGEFSRESLAQILDQALELAGKDHELRSRYRFHDIRIEREYEREMPKVYCSASKLRQVFFNIIKNGAEAMGEAATPAPVFRLRIRQDGDRARVEIEDNGPGMTEELQREIFDPFFTTKGKEIGTGLGLSVSSFIIRENHHGELRVCSQPGLGATFIIELPLSEPNAKQAAAAETESIIY